MLYSEIYIHIDKTAIHKYIETRFKIIQKYSHD